MRDGEIDVCGRLGEKEGRGCVKRKHNNQYTTRCYEQGEIQNGGLTEKKGEYKEAYALSHPPQLFYIQPMMILVGNLKSHDSV